MRTIFLKRIRLTARLFDWLCGQFTAVGVFFFVLAVLCALALGWHAAILDEMVDANRRLASVCLSDALEKIEEMQ